MSKFDLRDISEKLTASRDTEDVVDQLLAYLHAVRPDWHASLAFYEVSQDALVRVYDRTRGKLMRRDVCVPVDQLPARLVRKFFHPSAFFNADDRKNLLAKLFQTSPSYEPDTIEAPQIQPIGPPIAWLSAVCMPLADQDDLMAMLVIVSSKKSAFGSRAIGEVLPVKSLASLALARRLHAQGAGRRGMPVSAQETAQAEADARAFQEQLAMLQAQSQQLAAENATKQQRLEALTREIEALDRNSSAYREELEHVKANLGALEEQAGAASAHLHEAYSQLAIAQSRAIDQQRTLSFLREVFQVLSQEHEEEEFSRTLVSWFCEHFEVERCSLMRLDDARESMSILAQRGLDPLVANRVKVRVGQGIAGWVAHHRKPLFVRMREEPSPVGPSGQDVYNSDSFISVPLIHNDRLLGVLNLSNKRDGEPFNDVDLERAVLAGSVLAMTLGGQPNAHRAPAWA